MLHKFIYRSYKVKGDPESARKKLTTVLLEKGVVKIDDVHASSIFRYPSLVFSSKKPLTCISRLSMEVTEHNMNSMVKIGITFTKIRYSIIFIILFLFIIVPATLGYIQDGISGVMPPPVALLGIPLGFMVHYHVRWRVFRTLQYLIKHGNDG